VHDVNNRLEVGLALRVSGEPSYFAWSSTDGFRDLPFAGQTALWIDDAGVIYGERATAAGLLGFIRMVTNNGIVLLGGGRTAWALVGTTFTTSTP
jgi:hypothetical protein